MKRHVFIVGMLISQLSAAAVGLRAQETPEAAPSTRLEMEENYKALNARMEDLVTANEAMQKNLNKLRDEVQKLSTEVERANDKSKESATMDSIKSLKNAIEEVDKKRIEDQKLVLEKLDAFKKVLEKPVATPRPPVTPSVVKPAPPKTNTIAPAKPEDGKPQNGYNYSIQDGDILPKIVGRLNAQGVKVNQKQIMDANPGVNWSKLRINQVIFIPAPQ
jgi:gas vesicle protein